MVMILKLTNRPEGFHFEIPKEYVCFLMTFTFQEDLIQKQNGFNAD